jgi:hypothetical protein
MRPAGQAVYPTDELREARRTSNIAPSRGEQPSTEFPEPIQYLPQRARSWARKLVESTARLSNTRSKRAEHVKRSLSGGVAAQPVSNQQANPELSAAEAHQ